MISYYIMPKVKPIIAISKIPAWNSYHYTDLCNYLTSMKQNRFPLKGEAIKQQQSVSNIQSRDAQ